MADVYTLSIALDTTGGAKAAQDWQRSVSQIQRDTDKATTATASWAKQLGLARGQLKDFGAIGASVFAGDILAKVVGFNNVLGLVNAATGLAATGIRSLAAAFRDELFPQWEEGRKKAKAQAEGLKDLREEIERLRAASRGPGAYLFPKETSGMQVDAGFISTAGLNESRAAQLLSAVSDFRTRFGGQRPSAGTTYYEDQVRALQKQLLAAQQAEEKRLEIEKATTLEMEKQAKLALEFQERALRNRRAAGAEFEGVVGPSKDNPYRNSYNLLNGQGVGSAGSASFLGGLANLIPGGVSSLIGAATPGQPTRNTYSGYGLGSTQGGAMASLIVELTKKYKDAAVSGLELIKVQAEIEQNAKSAQLASDLGNRIAYGFEEAIFSGQKLSEVLRQLALDLARIVFRNTVTNQLAGYLTGAIGNGLSAGSGGSTGSAFPGFGAGESAGGTQGLMAGGTGGIGGGFRLSARQQRDNLARSF